VIIRENHFWSKWKNQVKRISSDQFNLKANSGSTNTVVDPNNLDLFYNQNNFSNGAFSIATFRGNSQVFNALDPQTYGGDLMIHAAFANTEYKLKKLTAVLGLRGEQITKKYSGTHS
jgi:hypothetical protein